MQIGQAGQLNTDEQAFIDRCFSENVLEDLNGSPSYASSYVSSGYGSESPTRNSKLVTTGTQTDAISTFKTRFFPKFLI